MATVSALTTPVVGSSVYDAVVSDTEWAVGWTRCVESPALLRMLGGRKDPSALQLVEHPQALWYLGHTVLSPPEEDAGDGRRDRAEQVDAEDHQDGGRHPATALMRRATWRAP